MVCLTVRQCFTVPLCFSQACWDWNWSSVLCLHIVLGHISWFYGRLCKVGQLVLWDACSRSSRRLGWLRLLIVPSLIHEDTFAHLLLALIYSLLQSWVGLRAASWLFWTLVFRFSVTQSLWWVAQEISLSCSHPSNKWCMSSWIQLACGRCEGKPQVLCRTRALEWILEKFS